MPVAEFVSKNSQKTFCSFNIIEVTLAKMTIQLARLLTSSCTGLRARSQYGYLASHISRRYVQEFPGLRFNNASPKDYMIVLPEDMGDTSRNELLRIPQKGEEENDLSKVNPEVCYKGMSRAIGAFDNFLTDFNNQTNPTHESVRELLQDVEKNLFPLDTAYNLLMIIVSLDGSKYDYPEFRQLMERYQRTRNQRNTGQIRAQLQHLSTSKKSDLDLNDLKILRIYQFGTSKRGQFRMIDESSLDSQREHLSAEMRLFSHNLQLANRSFSHTVDDPDLLAAVSAEFDDCHDLHHKERTPLTVDTSTYHRFMRVCPDRFVRHMLWQTYNRRCSPKGLIKQNNLPSVNNIRVLKRKIADLTGHRAHFDHMLEGTMASTRQRVLDSLNAIREENSSKLMERLSDLQDYAVENSFAGSGSLGLREYDLDYWSNKYMYDVMIGLSEFELKKFFPFKSVMQGVENYFKSYFSIEFSTKTKPNDKFWSEDVRFIEVSRRGESLGTIIYSPYKTPQGRSEAYYARIRGRVQGAKHLPARFISTSFNQEDSGRQANLSIAEVMMLFKCFSTVIQRLMYNYPYYELNVYGGLETDVNGLIPYLCDAHFLSDHRILQSCSTRDGSKTIDTELASRIVKAHVYSRPFKTWYELFKAHLSMDLHASMTNTKTVVDELYSRYSPFPRDSDNFDYCAMDDVFLGPNDGLQYADLWSKQLANFCLAQVQDPSGKLNDEKARDMFNRLVDSLFNADNLTSEEKLTALTGQRFEPEKLGLGVL